MIAEQVLAHEEAEQLLVQQITSLHKKQDAVAMMAVQRMPLKQVIEFEVRLQCAGEILLTPPRSARQAGGKDVVDL